MIWDYWFLILGIEFAMTAGLAWSLMKVFPARRTFATTMLCGFVVPALIIGIAFVLMMLPSAGSGDGILFAGCVVWALMSLPICLGGSITNWVICDWARATTV